MSPVRVLEYLDAAGSSPFKRWFERLDETAAARVGAYLYRLLLAGSAKKGQDAAIKAALEAWQDYKRRKRA